MSKYNLGIIGGGFVGGATLLLKSENVNCVVYDLDATRCIPRGTTFEDILNTDAVFICVWTPITTNEKNYGQCDTSIVEKIITNLKTHNYKGFIIVRSTVPVGFCESQDVYFMPEFLTEKNWKNDFLTCEKWVFGIKENNAYENEKFKNLITDVINYSDVIHKDISFVTTSTAEMIKYFRNCFLSLKVGFSNEMYRFSLSKNLDYEVVRNIACEDRRIGLSHTLVPGHDGKYGFGGHCFPKDMASMEFQMKTSNVRSDIISAAIKRNEEFDRTEKDWL